MRFSRITVDPDLMAGVPTIRGLRIPVATVVSMIADGMTGLAAAALRARDGAGPAIRFQLLSRPESDDRLATWSARNFTGTPFMTRPKLVSSWAHYLASTPGSPYAAPARAGDLSGLPTAYIATAEFDPLRRRAPRLRAAPA